VSIIKLQTLQPVTGWWPQELAWHRSQAGPSVSGGQTHSPVTGWQMCPGRRHSGHSAHAPYNSVTMYTLQLCNYQRGAIHLKLFTWKLAKSDGATSSETEQLKNSWQWPFQFSSPSYQVPLNILAEFTVLYKFYTMVSYHSLSFFCFILCFVLPCLLSWCISCLRWFTALSLITWLLQTRQ